MRLAVRKKVPTPSRSRTCSHLVLFTSWIYWLQRWKKKNVRTIAMTLRLKGTQQVSLQLYFAAMVFDVRGVSNCTPDDHTNKVFLLTDNWSKSRRQ